MWEGLTHRLGDFAPYMTAAQGTAAEQGVEVALVGSIGDGYVSKVYFTVTDRTGGRFNSHTAISARLDGALSGAAGSLGCQVLEFDQAAGRLLVEAGATGLSGDAPVTLEVSGIDPGFRRVQEARFRPPASGQALDTETTAEGDVVLKAGQTPQDSPDTADFSISSMGFDGQGRFHIRLTMAEGFTGDGLLAVPYDAGDEQIGSTLERIAVDGGMDCVVGGITPADAAAVLSHPQGGRKGVAASMAFRVLLNKADTPERAAWGREIQEGLARQGIFSAVTHYEERERGGLCLF